MNPELDGKLSAFLDGALTPAELVELRAELERSPELRQRLAQLEAVDDELRALPSPEASADLKERLRGRLAEEPASEPRSAGRQPPVSTPRPRRGLRWVAAATVAAAVFAFVLFSFPTPTVDDEPRVPEPVARNDDAAGDEALEEFLRGDTLAEELGADAIAAASDEDVDVIDVLDLLAAMDELGTASG